MNKGGSLDIAYELTEIYEQYGYCLNKEGRHKFLRVIYYCEDVLKYMSLVGDRKEIIEVLLDLPVEKMLPNELIIANTVK